MTRNEERSLHIIHNVRYPSIINRAQLNLPLAITFPALNARSSYLYKTRKDSLRRYESEIEVMLQLIYIHASIGVKTARWYFTSDKILSYKVDNDNHSTLSVLFYSRVSITGRNTRSSCCRLRSLLSDQLWNKITTRVTNSSSAFRCTVTLITRQIREATASS